MRPNEIHREQARNGHHHEAGGDPPLQATDFVDDVWIGLPHEDLIDAQSAKREQLC